MTLDNLFHSEILKVAYTSITKLNSLLSKNGYEGNYIKQRSEEPNGSNYAISTVITDDNPLQSKLSEILNIKIVDIKWTNFNDEVEIKFK